MLSLAVTSDNARIVSGGGDRTVFLWDVVSATVVRRYQGHFARVNTVAFGAGDSVIISGSLDATVRLWDVKGGSTKPIMTWEEAGDSVSCVGVLGGDEGWEVFAGGVDGRVRVYDLRMGLCFVDVIGRMSTSVTALLFLLMDLLYGNDLLLTDVYISQSPLLPLRPH